MTTTVTMRRLVAITPFAPAQLRSNARVGADQGDLTGTHPSVSSIKCPLETRIAYRPYSYADARSMLMTSLPLKHAR